MPLIRRRAVPDGSLFSIAHYAVTIPIHNTQSILRPNVPLVCRGLELGQGCGVVLLLESLSALVKVCIRPRGTHHDSCEDQGRNEAFFPLHKRHLIHD
ncbi:hypothetical protein SDC9_194814 [bioreactor metagenome]|uniref:Uncharacterized protein n=1 Tax=bioreactor metagenome TaxID=1076179 RepID=A0A645IIP0_9ZZZZ